MEENKLTTALIQNLDQEIDEYERCMEAGREYHFSRRYERRKEKILRMTSEEVHKGIIYGMEGRHPRVRRTIVLIAAVVILLAATSTALAIIKPEIFYHIKEKITNWRITFQTNEENAPAFVYIEPEVPEGYEVIDEAKGSSYYYITYRNEQGDTIGYSQMLPEDATISIDSEQAKPHEEIHGGQKYVVYERAEASTIIFDNGDYVFALDGNCDKQLLYPIAEKLIH